MSNRHCQQEGKVYLFYFCARFRDGTEIVNHVCLCHPDTSVTNDEQLVLLVGDDTDIQVLLSVESAWIGE